MRQLNSIFRIVILLAGTLFAQDPYDYGHLFPSTPCLKCPCDPDRMFWTADMSVLAWQAREEGLAFALKNDSLINIDFKWEPGFKVTFGADFPIRAWDVNMRWTHFHTESHTTATTDLISIWALPIAGTLYNTAKGSWTLLLNGFDMEMGYHAFLSPAMTLRFHCDVKVVTVDQYFDIAYTARTLFSTTQFSNRSIGAGPRIGFESQWLLGKGFSLLASLAGSLPLWHYRIYRNDFDVAPTGDITSQFRQRFWTFRTILETALGLGWDTCLGCRSQFPFGLAASYELHYFPEQNMMAMQVNPGVLNLVFEPRGDLHLQGATFNLHFGF